MRLLLLLVCTIAVASAARGGPKLRDFASMTEAQAAVKALQRMVSGKRWIWVPPAACRRRRPAPPAVPCRYPGPARAHMALLNMPHAAV